MKRVEAIIRAHLLDELKDALAELGVVGMTVTEVRGFGRSGGKQLVFRGSAYAVDFMPKIKVELVAPEALAPQIADVILGSARTGNIGDGKLFTSKVDQCVRVRTGERGEAAL